MKCHKDIFKTTACLVLIINQLSFSQEKSISITIDDVPNTSKYLEDNFNPVLLNLLDSLDVPFTIFINEDKVYKTDSIGQNKELLHAWIKNDLATIGNHTYSHSRYSDVGPDSFVIDIEKGEDLTRAFAKKYNKDLRYFRFPFNDLGKDSVQHVQISNILKSKGYVTAPFTVESSDWMFNYVYQYYLDNGQVEKAEKIGTRYVEKTIALIKFYEAMAQAVYNRQVKHIYLCHDNAINADYLPTILNRVKQEGYHITGFEESLTDPIYKQNDTYYKKWGISWLYRWMDTQKERIKWMKKEPDLSEIEKLYEEISKR
ncbi:polysaccharide deacetylase family protein [Sinomicrobium sp. M5D2P9]